MYRKLLPVLILIGLSLVTVNAHNFDNSVIWTSDVAGGNITFAHDFTADTFTVTDNQIRFTNFEMNGNGSWSGIGFRNPDFNCTMNVTHVGTDYVKVNCIVDGDGTTYETYLPDAGLPERILGTNGFTWITPTLQLIKNVNGTITLEWTTTGGGNGVSLLLILVLIMMFVIYAMGGRRR